MTYRVVTREEIGLSEKVLNSSGGERHPLNNEPLLIAHYTGVYVKYGDPGDTIPEILNLERWAASQGKPNEYNYILDQDDDELIYEYAGPYQAAHSAGENSISVGVLFFNGVEEPLTDQQVDKFRWLRDEVLIPFGVLSPSVDTIPHKDAPGAATACPNTYVMNRWSELETKWAPAPIPDVPLPNTYGMYWLLEKGQTLWGIATNIYPDNSPNKVINAIMALNNVTDPTQLPVGKHINLPGKAHLL